MRIPVKRYVPDSEAMLTMEHLLGPNAATGRLLENAFIVARELKRLLAHHEEETKWMYAKLKEYEEQTIDLFPDRDKWEVGGEG